ncbi:MAG: Ribonuclease VapC3 [Candidatus Bathyarchaeota archaeon BA1]|nr:MAG: Ribonuclease VapC3 [Candidatus Bathyarchaeota archaeon BA1]
MLRLVVDASVVVKWVLSGEPYEKNAVKLKDNHVSKLAELHTPNLIIFEVANTLMRAVKLERLTMDEVKRSLVALEKLKVSIHDARWDEMTETVEIANRLNTTVYDASYMYLAKKLAIPLITADEELAERAGQEVKTLHLKEY